MDVFVTRAKKTVHFLGKGVVLAYVFVVLPCVLLIMDMIATMRAGHTIALHLFLLALFAPVAITALYITWYKLHNRTRS